MGKKHKKLLFITALIINTFFLAGALMFLTDSKLGGIDFSFFSNDVIDFYELIGFQNFGVGIFVSYLAIILLYCFLRKK